MQRWVKSLKYRICTNSTQMLVQDGCDCVGQTQRYVSKPLPRPFLCDALSNITSRLSGARYPDSVLRIFRAVIAMWFELRRPDCVATYVFDLAQCVNAIQLAGGYLTSARASIGHPKRICQLKEHRKTHRLLFSSRNAEKQRNST